ncbi:hypothetical protein [Haloarchaeobius amylolyticus]|uniref:hypothetical protein n=1 Tax=Haloarchaeobius amylolyticus TaxID=1198296 RepID=UPI00226FCE21|nr:hypothetical protein [Haloarchaeobius amylolyticus]
MANPLSSFRGSRRANLLAAVLFLVAAAVVWTTATSMPQAGLAVFFALVGVLGLYEQLWGDAQDG